MKYATLVASDTSTSMLAVPFLRLLYAPLWNRDPMVNCTGVARAHLRNDASDTF